VRAGRATALLDAFLAPHEARLYEPPFPPAAATGLDVVLCTHEHIDHFDGESAPGIAAASPGAVFVVPTPIVDMVTEAGIPGERVIGLQPGDVFEVAGLTIRAIRAKHGVTMEDAFGFGEELSGGLVRFLGYVIEGEGLRLYHAGDTIHYEGMEEELRRLDIDVAMLPINGRDPERERRGIVGNLTEREAAWLAKEMEAGMLIPMHHDMIRGNLGYPELLVQSVQRDHPGVPVFVPSREAPFVCASARPR
jgi:L-ascorbate metabolism protein UlaG (beta-lactamase superfamily)